jgi:hypothetical protein
MPPPPDKVKFSTMLMKKGDFLPLLAMGDFSRLIFQHSNGKNDPKRQKYELSRAYALRTDGSLIHNFPFTLVLPTPPATEKMEDDEVHLANLLLTLLQLLNLIPNNDDYEFLRFEPRNAAMSPNTEYVSYDVFPVKADGKTPAANTIVPPGPQPVLLPTLKEIANPSPPF